MQANKEVKKLYYSIGEVSEITKLKQYVLRYWETEFVQLKPAKILTLYTRILTKKHDVNASRGLKSLFVA